MNEWGEYPELKDRHAWISVRQDGVLQAILDNNPAIETLTMGENRVRIEDWEWEDVGESLGKNSCLRHLQLPSDYGVRGIYNMGLFYKGLARNRSIRSLRITFDRLQNELMNRIHPLLVNDSNIESIYLGYPHGSVFDTESVKRAVAACSSLRSITFDIAPNWNPRPEGLFQIIAQRPGLRHVAIKNYFISGQDCIDLKGLLCREDCEMLSLNLDRVYFSNHEDIALLASGVAHNKSLKCLRFQGLLNVFVRSFFVSPRSHASSSLESVILEGMGVSSLNFEPAVMMTHLPKLKSLSLLGRGLDVSSSLGQYSNLHKLKILTYLDGKILQNLAMSTSLKVLDLSACTGFSSENFRQLFNTLDARLEELYLGKIITSDTMMAHLSQYLVTSLSLSQSLRVLHIPYLRNRITVVGWGLFANMLQYHSCLEEVNIHGCGCEDNDHVAIGIVGLLSNALRANSNLKRLQLSISDITDLQVLANILESPTCALDELKLCYKEDSLFGDAINVQGEAARVAQILAAALQTNSSLKVLYFFSQRRFERLEWPLLSSVLCNKLSIDATYHSNHKLECLVLGRSYNSVPVEICSMLRLNRNTNKQAVAREKIIEHHSVKDVNFQPSSLPVSLSWAGNASSNRNLSVVYEMLRNLPHLIGNKEAK